MSKSRSPFTKSQLLPQEERLEVLKQKGNLFIGIPKETAFQEKRVCLAPDAVSALVHNGHRVLLESGAGIGASFSDKDYSEAGAEITKDTTKVFSCPIILKIEPPSLNEIELINPQAILISALQLKTQAKSYFEALASKLAILGVKLEGIVYDDWLETSVQYVYSVEKLRGIINQLVIDQNYCDEWLKNIVDCFF